MSLKIHQTEITTLCSQMTQQGGDGVMQGYNYSHCKSALRGASCPWKENIPSEAKKGETSFMLRMNDGSLAAGPP